MALEHKASVAHQSSQECLNSLNHPSAARNEHISSGRQVAGGRCGSVDRPNQCHYPGALGLIGEHGSLGQQSSFSPLSRPYKSGGSEQRSQSISFTCPHIGSVSHVSQGS